MAKETEPYGRKIYRGAQGAPRFFAARFCAPCGKRGRNEVGVHALRGGTVAGQHTVHFFGVDEELSLTHTAASRQIFVNGALHMARRLRQMPRGRWELQDILFGGKDL